MVLCLEEATDLPNTLLVLALLVNEKIFNLLCRLIFMTCEFVPDYRSGQTIFLCGEASMIDVKSWQNIFHDIFCISVLNLHLILNFFDLLRMIWKIKFVSSIFMITWRIIVILDINTNQLQNQTIYLSLIN